ncbi:MAG: hydroxyacid dehydrogenase [Verrucomicrobia bacterium]|nr:hydroxyacid dehydrogenase [Verrucomicrobiota bacterium]
MSTSFRVGITRDFLNPDGSIGFGDIGLGLFEGSEQITFEFLAENRPELEAEQVSDYDALLVLSPKITENTLENSERLSLVARFGVGYDSVDVEACTRRGVLLAITPDGVRRPVATAVMTLLLALSHKLIIKDRLTRNAQWSERLNHMGIGLTGRTLGVIGLGNIGKEVFTLAAPFQMRHLAFDPYVHEFNPPKHSIQLTDLDTLLCESDFVAVCCALTPETHHLINADRLSRMKPSAYLINVARGPIVDQRALTTALRNGGIQGAGLDVFEQEPTAPDDPLLKLENVILSPHALCWTDECFAGIGRSACQSILDLASGKIPGNIVNREAVSSHTFQQKLKTYQNARRVFLSKHGNSCG